MSEHEHDLPAPESPTTPPSVAPWERRAALVIAALLLIFAAAWVWWQFFAQRDLVIPNHTLTQSEVHDVLRAINTDIIHEDAAESFAENFGADALGILVPIIRDRAESPSKRGRAAYILGKYRRPEHTQHIVNLIEHILRPAMDAEGLAGVAYAIEGLGWAADERAIQTLTVLAGKAFWDQREPAPYKIEPDDAPRIQRLLRERAVRALGRAPHGAGIPALKQLANTAPELTQPIHQALSHARRARWGLT